MTLSYLPYRSYITGVGIALFVVWSYDDDMDSFIERVASSCENVAICAT